MLELRIYLFTSLLLAQACLHGVYADDNSVSSDNVSEMEKSHKETLNKLNLLGYILTKSMRTKEVQASDNQKAIGIIGAAYKHYNAAKELLDNEDFDGSNIEIQKSLQNISVAFRLVVNKDREAELARKQYELLYSRVKNFSDLFNQLPEEKVKGILDSNKMNQLIKYAETLYQKDQPKKALIPLTESADMLERALSDARKDETVVYALEFATPEDEYKYEMDRNENYTLLTSIILSSSPPENRKKIPLIRMLIDKNEDLVVEAEKLFENKDIEKAIKLLEKGNKTLVRALRLGGLTL